MRVYVPVRLEVKFMGIIREHIHEHGGSMFGQGDNIYFINQKQYRKVKDLVYVLK